MSPLSTEELLKYKDRLPGLIPVERIVAVDFPRPARQVVEGFKKLEEPTPTVSDILDSLGIEGTIPSSELKPIVPGKTIVGPATTLRYFPERDTVAQSYEATCIVEKLLRLALLVDLLPIIPTLANSELIIAGITVFFAILEHPKIPKFNFLG